jgi:hypothetical protein
MVNNDTFRVATYNICSDPRMGKLAWRVAKQINAIQLLQPHVLCLQEMALPLTRRAYFDAFHLDYHWCEPPLRPYQWVRRPELVFSLCLIYCIWWVSLSITWQQWFYLGPLVLILPQLIVLGLCQHEQLQYTDHSQWQPPPNQDQGTTTRTKEHPFQPGVNWTGLGVLLRKDTFTRPVIVDQGVFPSKGYPCTVLGCLKSIFLYPSYLTVRAKHSNGNWVDITNCHLVDGCNEVARQNQLSQVVKHPPCPATSNRVILGDFNTQSGDLQTLLRLCQSDASEWCVDCDGIDHILSFNGHDQSDVNPVRHYWTNQLYSDHPLVVGQAANTAS